METSDGSQRPEIYQNHFGRRPEPQQSRNVGFKKPEVGSGGLGGRPQNVKQQGVIVLRYRNARPTERAIREYV